MLTTHATKSMLRLMAETASPLAMQSGTREPSRLEAVMTNRRTFMGALVMSVCSRALTVPAQEKTMTRGALVVAGGGKHIGPIDDAFEALAGKRVAVITTASSFADTAEKDISYYWRQPPAGIVTEILHTRSSDTANNPDFADRLDHATAVWIAGGDQKKLEVYVGTRVHVKLFALLNRGGVVAGISAGAAAVGSVMIRQGNPEPDLGQGFGFLENVVIDQHFDTRNRTERLLRAVKKNPASVGIGISEETAIVVRADESVEVVGIGTVRHYTSTSDTPHIFYPHNEFDLRTGALLQRKEAR